MNKNYASDSICFVSFSEFHQAKISTKADISRCSVYEISNQDLWNLWTSVSKFAESLYISQRQGYRRIISGSPSTRHPHAELGSQKFTATFISSEQITSRANRLSRCQKSRIQVAHSADVGQHDEAETFRVPRVDLVAGQISSALTAREPSIDGWKQSWSRYVVSHKGPDVFQKDVNFVRRNVSHYFR